MTRVLCLLGIMLAAVGLLPSIATAQCPSGQLDYDYDLGTFDELLGNVLVDENGVNLWLNGSPPVWQKIPGQVGPGFVNVDNDGNGINDDDHFDMLAAVINGHDSAVLGNLSSGTVSAIRNAFNQNKAKVRTLKVTLHNVRIFADIGFTSITRTISVTTGEQACVDVPAVGNQCFDVPPLWGEGGILYDVDPQLEERVVNMAAGYMTIGDAQGVTYFQNVLGQVTLAALIALVPQLLEDLKDAKDISCVGVQPIHVETTVDFGISADVTVDVAAQDICNALNTFINQFNCGNGFSCQTSFLGATGNLNGSGTNNRTSYLNADTRQEWLIAESIVNPPLQISQSPSGATVESGTPTSFSFTHQGGGTGARSFKWDTIDPEAYFPVATVSTSQELAFSYPLAGNTNLYTGVVCDGLWQRRTQPFQFTVNAGTFRITTQPAGANGRVPGTPFTFNVEVRGGNSAPSYQWQFNDGSGFVNVGPNSPTFTIPSLDLPDSGQYRVVVTGDSVLTSNAVTLEVVDSIRFQTHPASAAVYVGTQVTFAPNIIGAAVGPINYQWLKNGNEISGANEATLNIQSAQLSDNGKYSLRIFDNTYDVTSNEATLEVALEPSFTQQPQGGGGFEGNNFTFTAQVAGGLTFLNYQWFFIPDGGGEPQPVGGNSNTLQLTDLLPANQGTYYVEVSDLLQTITSNQVFLEIFPPFEIVEQPQGAVKFVGAGHTFTVGIEGGTGTLHYQWYKGNTPVGPDNPSYTIDPLALTDSGSYRVVVSDDNGSNTSDIAVLDVRPPLQITQQPVNVGVYLGNSVTLSIDSTGGIGDIEYRWKRGSVTVGFGKNFIIPEATLATNGQYYCEVSDDFTTVVSNTITITAVPAVSFTTQPTNVYRFIGDSATFTVAAINGLGSLSYRWFKNNVELPYTGPVLQFEKVFLADAGVYRCEVKDQLATTSSEGAELFVFELPDAAGVEVESNLTASQVVPPTISEANGQAFGLLKSIANSPSGEFNLVMNLVHSVPGPTNIRMRKGVIGQNGPLYLTFNTATSPSVINRNLSRSEAAEMLGGFYYLTVETNVFPAGAVRGQINANIPEPEGEEVESCNNAVTGTLTACSAHFNRIDSAATAANCNGSATDAVHNNMPYNAIQFTWLGTGAFTAAVTAGGTTISDSVISLHCDPFVPLAPNAGLIAWDDDDAEAPGMSEFLASDGITLSAGNTYWLVITTFRGASTPTSGAVPQNVAGDFGEYRVCLPAGAVVMQTIGGGGDECIGVAEGEGDGGVEGEGEAGEEGEAEVVEGGVDGEEGEEGEAEVVEGEGEASEEGEAEVIEGEGEGPAEETYAADVNANGEIDLEELLRVIQLFNNGSYFCSNLLVDEDGYALVDLGIAFGTGDCTYHSTDYEEDNRGVIVLSELLRLIQFFNLGGVIACPGQTEDGFCIPE